jgi:hypothetical protein
MTSPPFDNTMHDEIDIDTSFLDSECPFSSDISQRSDWVFDDDEDYDGDTYSNCSSQNNSTSSSNNSIEYSHSPEQLTNRGKRSDRTLATTTITKKQRYVRPDVRVEHTYRDRSNLPSHLTSNDTVFGHGKNKHEVKFPSKLHVALDEIENDGFGDIISWQPHGRCFVVHQPKRFAVLLAAYFPGISKFASFQRQLNLYGFRRISSGNDKNGYYHECFLRYRPDLLQFMHRVSLKGIGVRVRSIAAEEPNFYQMPFVQPINAATATTAASSIVHRDLYITPPMLIPSTCDFGAVTCTAPTANTVREMASPTLSANMKHDIDTEAMKSRTPPTPPATVLDISSSLNNYALHHHTDLESFDETDFAMLLKILEPRPLPPWPMQRLSSGNQDIYVAHSMPY